MEWVFLWHRQVDRWFNLRDTGYLRKYFLLPSFAATFYSTTRHQTSSAHRQLVLPSSIMPWTFLENIYSILKVSQRRTWGNWDTVGHFQLYHHLVKQTLFLTHWFLFPLCPYKIIYEEVVSYFLKIFILILWDNTYLILNQLLSWRWLKNWNYLDISYLDKQNEYTTKFSSYQVEKKS